MKKHILKYIAVTAMALIFFLMAYMVLVDVHYEKAVDITTISEDESVIEVSSKEEFVQKVELTLPEISAIGIKIPKNQEKIKDIELGVEIYAQNGEQIYTCNYFGEDLCVRDEIYASFETPIPSGVYEIRFNVITPSSTGTNLELYCAEEETDELQIVVSQKNYSWSQDEFRTLMIFVFAILSTLMIVLYVLLFVCKVEFHWCYLVVGIVLGIIFMFVIPPYATPDEQTHISSAIYISDKLMGYGGPVNEDAAFVARETEVNNGLNAYLSRNAYDSFLQKMVEPLTDEGRNVIDTSHELAAPLSIYLVPAIGITIGRVLSLNGVMTLLLGTLFHVVFFVLMATYAIKKIPFGKMVLAGVCLFPMTLQQISSFSYDNPLIAATLVVVALGIKWCYTEEKRTAFEYVMYLFSSLILLLGKSGVYMFVIFLPLVYQFSKEKLLHIWKEYRIQTIFFFLGTVFVFFRNKIFTVVSSIFLPAVESNVGATGDASGGNTIAWLGVEGYTVGELVRHPVQLVKIFYNTFVDNIDWYPGTMFGTSLGWFQISIPWFLIIISIVIVLLATVKPQNESLLLQRKDKLLLGATSVISIVLCMLAMLLLWTPKGSIAILGVQGRYFLPSIIGFFLILRTDKMQVKKNIDKELLFANIVLIAVVIFFVFQRMYLI